MTTSFWSRYFPRRSVVEISQPTWVRVDARVASPNALTSPLTGFTCAAAHYWLLTDRNVRIGGIRSFYARASGWFGEQIVLASSEGPTISIPLTQAALTNSLEHEDAALLTNAPSALRRQIAAIGLDDGPVFFSEVRLSAGDRVELRAVVEPTPSPGGYRGTSAPSAATLRACPELGSVQIFDRMLG